MTVLAVVCVVWASAGECLFTLDYTVETVLAPEIPAAHCDRFVPAEIRAGVLSCEIIVGSEPAPTRPVERQPQRRAL